MDTPTLGRIVHVNIAQSDDKSLTWKPAIITDVHGPTVISAVLFDAFADSPVRVVRSVTCGEDAGQWRWPPRA